MQEFPALAYKVKELHAAIQNGMSLFTDAQRVKKESSFEAQAFRDGPCAEQWCESRSRKNLNSAPRRPLGEPVLLSVLDFIFEPFLLPDPQTLEGDPIITGRRAAARRPQVLNGLCGAYFLQQGTGCRSRSSRDGPKGELNADFDLQH